LSRRLQRGPASNGDDNDADDFLYARRRLQDGLRPSVTGRRLRVVVVVAVAVRRRRG
jgi:hypothetical protein